MLACPVALFAFLQGTGTSSDAVIVLSCGALVLSLMGGTFGIRSANRSGSEGSERVIRVAVHILAVVVPVGVIFVIALPSFVTGPMFHNENAAVATCKAFAEAEEIYRRRDGTQYADSLDKLFRLSPPSDPALVGKVQAEAEGEPGTVKIPCQGYCFKILKAQGPKANGGQRSYIVDGKMTGGYALVAYPFKWGVTGIDTFMINNDGTIVQKDLGKDTSEIVRGMTEFNEDSGLCRPQ
jgi:hypothetical protein